MDQQRRHRRKLWPLMFLVPDSTPPHDVAEMDVTAPDDKLHAFADERGRKRKLTSYFLVTHSMAR